MMQATAGREAGGREVTVLVVDDDPRTRAVAGRALERAGYTVLQAAHAEQALRVWARRGASIDAVVADMVMPGRSGRALIDDLRAQAPQLPVVLMSGYTPPALEGRGMAVDGRALLPKPFTPARLIDTLRAALDSVG